MVIKILYYYIFAIILFLYLFQKHENHQNNTNAIRCIPKTYKFNYEKFSLPAYPKKPSSIVPGRGPPYPWQIVTKPRDKSLYTSYGTFLNIPQHIEGGVVNITASVIDAWNVGKSIYDMPSDMGTIIGKPNEPLPSDSGISKILNKYT